MSIINLNLFSNLILINVKLQYGCLVVLTLYGDCVGDFHLVLTSLGIVTPFCLVLVMAQCDNL